MRSCVLLFLLPYLVEHDGDSSEEYACHGPDDPCVAPVERDEAPCEISCGHDHPVSGCDDLKELVLLAGLGIILFLKDLLVAVLDLESAPSGYGRKIRKVRTGSISDLRVICDRSSIEVFADNGRYVMSTRFHPEEKEIEISGSCEFQYRPIGEMRHNI